MRLRRAVYEGRWRGPPFPFVVVVAFNLRVYTVGGIAVVRGSFGLDSDQDSFVVESSNVGQDFKAANRWGPLAALAATSTWSKNRDHLYFARLPNVEIPRSKGGLHSAIVYP